MDTNAYLKRHGWRGDGHSLDTTNRGISRPLLVSKKVDMLGVGLNKHAAVSDQWWMRAFDEGLKNLGSGTKSTLANVREKGVHFGGLYGRFVKGETVKGTMEDEAKKAEGSENAGQKRKRDNDGEDTGKSSKRKLDGADSAAGERLVKRVENQTKAVVHEAVKRGLIPKGRKDGMKKTTEKSPKIAETIYAQIFDQAGLYEASANGEGSSKSARKQAKLTREKLQREVKRVARAYFTRQMSAADRALVMRSVEDEDALRRAKGDLKQVERYDLAARKSTAKAAKAARRKERAEQKQTSRTTMSAEKAARYAERAAKKGVSVEDYILRRGEKAMAKKSQSSSSDEAAVTFVVDITGDSALKTQTMLQNTPVVPPTSLDVVDKEGKIRYTVLQGTPVPLDPTIWSGTDTKKLPKAVRLARKQWMENKRTTKKQDVEESLEGEEKMGLRKRKHRASQKVI